MSQPLHPWWFVLMGALLACTSARERRAEDAQASLPPKDAGAAERDAAGAPESEAPEERDGSARVPHAAHAVPDAGEHASSSSGFKPSPDCVHAPVTPSGYGTGPLTDPVNGVVDPRDLTPNTPVFSGSTDGLGFDGFPGFRVRRGGSFDFWPILAASGRRMHGELSGQFSGFRIARTLRATSAEEPR